MKMQERTRRSFLKTLGIGGAAFALGACARGVPAASQKAKKPNILLILVDDLGFGDLSSYGAKDLRTPHIDRLMTAGMRLDPFYANCPVCSPTRASLLSGRYPDLVGVPGVIRTHLKDNWGHLTKEAVLLPSVLKTAGYDTAMFGKWHLGLKSPNLPNERGFDHFHGFLGDMMEDYYHHRRNDHNFMRLNGKTIDPKGYATDLFTDWTVDYIRERRDEKKPFFLYLPYNAPHTPIQPPEDWFQKVLKREAGITEKRAKIVALIEHLDDGIGKVVKALKETGQSENTLLVFTSDNGGQVNVEGRNGTLNGGKQDMLEGGIRVPMCAVWPGRIEANSKRKRLAMTMDLFPTICEAAGAKFSHEIEGKSILPTLLGQSQPEEDRFLFWVRLEGGKYKGKPYYAARRGNWKLLQNTATEPYRLYNLETDPGESHPLGEDHPQYAPLHKALMDHIKKASAIPWQRPDDAE